MTMVRPRRRYATFDSLKSRHFRWFWLGRLASSATMQMGAVAEGWLVYELTGSALALGWVSAGWSITASVLSLYGGILSDRVEKRHLLLWIRVAMVIIYLALTALIATGLIRVWHLAVGSLLRGVFWSALMPAQNAYLAELVDRKTLLNAVSLNSVGMGLAGIFAASLAGYVIEFAGVEGVYLGIAILYALVILTLFKMPLTGRSDPGDNSVWSDLREGLGYLRVSQTLLPLLGFVFARGFLAMPYTTFMPKYAQDVMGLDASGLGILTAAPGTGSLISSFVLASLGDFRSKGKLLLVSGLVMGLALVGFASTQSFVLALALLAIVGAASNVCMVTNQTLIQVNCDDQFLGRAMSMYMMTFGLTRLGTIPAGGIADNVGVSLVILVQGVLFSLIALLVLLRPGIRRLE
jgi:MFS family permease